MFLGGYSETGPREANEDSFFVRSFEEVNSFSNGVNAFFMVSDGMGGYQGGDVASSMAVSSADRYLENLLEIARENRIEFEPDVALREIVQNAHEAIVAETQARGNSNMGATFVGVFASCTCAWIGHVGDSRAYMLRQGVLKQLTEDHSQVGRMLSQGILTEEEAQNHPLRNRIERALGFLDHDMDVTVTDLMEGDVLLLVSDGAYTALGADKLVACLDGAKDAELAARTVVKEALRNGTDDNTTAVVALNRTVKPAGVTQRMRVLPKSEKQGMEPQRTERRVAVHQSASDKQARHIARNDSLHRSRRQKNAARRKRSVPSLIPFVIIFILLIVVVVAVVATTTAKSSSSADQGSAPTTVQDMQPQVNSTEDFNQDSNNADKPVDAQTSTNETTRASSLASMIDSAQTTYLVKDSSARLRFVSINGEVRLASDAVSGLLDVRISNQSVVQAFSTTMESGGTVYRVLSGKYATELKDDCMLYVKGTKDFSSSISHLIDTEEYRELIGHLINAYSIEELENSVQYLALLNDDVELLNTIQNVETRDGAKPEDAVTSTSVEQETITETLVTPSEDSQDSMSGVSNKDGERNAPTQMLGAQLEAGNGYEDADVD